MGRLVEVITSNNPAVRNRSLDSLCTGMNTAELLVEAAALEAFRRSSDNLYERVRALFFLYALHRFHLCGRLANDTRSSNQRRAVAIHCTMVSARLPTEVKVSLAGAAGTRPWP